MDSHDRVPLLVIHVFETNIRLVWDRRGGRLMECPPLVPQNTGIVDEDSNPTKGIDSRLNDSRTVRNRGRIYHSFPSS